MLNAGLFGGAQLPDDSPRRTKHERTGRHIHSRGHERVGANDGASADDRAIKKDRAHPDEHLVVHRAGMDDGRVAHRDQFADERRKFIGHMDNDAVLNVCARTDLDAVDVAAQDGAVPDTGLRANDTSPMIVVILKLAMIVVIAFTKGEPGEKQPVERSAPS